MLQGSSSVRPGACVPVPGRHCGTGSRALATRKLSANAIYDIGGCARGVKDPAEALGAIYLRLNGRVALDKSEGGVKGKVLPSVFLTPLGLAGLLETWQTAGHERTVYPCGFRVQ